MEAFLKFIVEEALVIIPALWMLGAIIKHTEIVDNKWIPVILLVVSVVLTPLFLGGFTPQNIVQSLYVVGFAVFGHQLIKQTTEVDNK